MHVACNANLLSAMSVTCGVHDVNHACLCASLRTTHVLCNRTAQPELPAMSVTHAARAQCQPRTRRATKMPSTRSSHETHATAMLVRSTKRDKEQPRSKCQNQRTTTVDVPNKTKKTTTVNAPEQNKNKTKSRVVCHTT